MAVATCIVPNCLTNFTKRSFSGTRIVVNGMFIGLCSFVILIILVNNIFSFRALTLSLATNRQRSGRTVTLVSILSLDGTPMPCNGLRNLCSGTCSDFII